LLDLTPDERSRGVVTASAGNHAQAVAYHGARLGLSVEVVMPEHTPLIKVANTRRFGAGVRFHGATLSDAMVEAQRLELEEGRVLAHAFDDECVIAVKRLGDRTFPLIERYVDDIVAIDEAEIAAAVHLLLERQKLLAEGAGAVALAAVLGGKIPLRGRDIVVMVLSGGNIDVNLVGRIIDRGLVANGRLTRFAITVHDRPGHLARLAQLVAEAGANVLEVAHRRAFADISVRDVEIVMHVETRGREHVAAIMALLKQNGVAVRQDIRDVEIANE
jgi:threonine dehydratase